MYTINQLIKTGSDFAYAHRQINSFGSGDIKDFASSGVTKYPAMWVDYEPSVVSQTPEGLGTIQTVFKVYLLDRLLKSQANLSEIYSDLHLVALDYIAYCQSMQYFPQAQTILKGGDLNLQPLKDSFMDDEIAGWSFVITFKSTYEANQCQIPFDGSVIVPPNTGGTNINYTYTIVTFVNNENLSSQITGSNTTFTIANTPIASSEQVVYNGQVLRPTTDYTISGTTLTLTFTAETGTSLYISYRK